MKGWFSLIASAASPQSLLPFRYTDGIFFGVTRGRAWGTNWTKSRPGLTRPPLPRWEVGFWQSRYAVLTLDSQVPRHIGIIMDGNGRGPRKRGGPASSGGRGVVRAIKRVLDACEKLGVHALSIYAFSTENWSRPRAEGRALMRLFHETMLREIDEMHRRGVRIVWSGRREDLSPRMRDRIDEAVKLTSNKTTGVLNVCLNYGGRAEVVAAAQRIVADGLTPAQVDETAIAARLYVPDLPDPDLIIRTAGERRMSNFLLWQSAYSEMLVTESLWPDFDEPDLKAALADYASRVRRFWGRPEDELQDEAN